MKTDAEIKAEMRLRAVEVIVCKLCAVLLTTIPPETAESILQGLLNAAKNVFPGVDPELSDHYSAEFEAAMQRLVTMQKEYMAEAKKKIG